MTELTCEEQLSLISKAWGRQRGYCFFPTISGTATEKRERILSYSEGPEFLWPRDRAKILARMEANKGNDLYWCPNLFEAPKRQLEFAMDEHCLWADLDEVNPKDIDDYPPTIAWETSPGRFQALWLISGGDIQGASWAGRENQALTYHLGADQSGWDSTQLLRIPGWHNYKPEYRRKNGTAPQGRLITKTGRRYLVDEFNDLPPVPTATIVSDVVEGELDRIDRHEVWGRVRLKVSQRVRELVAAREVAGDRSDALWEIERELADAGCSVVEIVAVVRATVWNKFAGRADELRRLTTEATKAVGLRTPEAKAQLEAEIKDRPHPTNLFELVRDIKAPRWLVRDVLTEGAVGFIAGQPKSFKSWTALDMALSVASGQPFLGHFPVEQPGPVLYIQEEDSPSLVKTRLFKVWPGKLGDKVTVDETGHIVWVPGPEVIGFPDIDAYIGQGFSISDNGWQSWLDEMMGLKKYRLLVMDPLMMMAGEVEENKAQAMTEHVFKPLKQLARKHNCAIMVVHHMKKGDPRTPQRGGQLLLGSVANHAWSEDSLYFRLGRGGDVICEQESKSAPVPGFKISHIRNKKWEPIVSVNKMEMDDNDLRDGHEGDHDDVTQPYGTDGPSRKARGRSSSPPKARAEGKAVSALRELGAGAHKFSTILETARISQQSATNQLNRALEKGLLTKTEWGYYELVDA